MKRTKRQACLFLTFTLVLSLLLYVQAPDGLIPVTEIDISNLLTGVVEEEPDASGGQVWYLCNSVESAGEKFREALKQRKTKIVIMLSGTAAEQSRADKDGTFADIYYAAMQHTGAGNEGDYLKWDLGEYSADYSYTTSTYEIYVPYLDDAAEEAQTAEAIRALEESLPITSKDSTYEKIYTIYDYLANHITYDNDDESNLPHTAYDAIVNGKAVCQGYATLFYRILLDYGIDNRIVASNNHAWNLVCLNGKYYECDLTWDSQGVQAGDPYQYFLKADLSKGDNGHNWQMNYIDSSVTKLVRADTDFDVTLAQDDSYDITEVDIPSVAASVTLTAPTLKVTKKSSAAVLKWSAVDNAQGYYVYRKIGSGKWKKIAETTKTSYKDKKVSKGTYRYRVCAYNGEQKGSYSESKKITR